MAPSAPHQGEGHRQRPRQGATALIAYFETSAFVKLVLDEPGSEEASAVWRGADRRVASRLLYPEARAALALARRLGRLDAVGLRRARTLVERLWLEVDCIEVTDPIARRAGELAERLDLRAYDAVHVASAEAAGDAEAVVATADADVRDAVAALGLAVT